MPSENDLSHQFKITRATVRQALEELVKEGYIEKRQGKGSVVISDRKTLGLLSFKGFSEVLASSTLVPETINLRKPQRMDWEEPFFYELSDKEIKNGCYKVERIRKVDGKPVMYENTFLPATALVNLELFELDNHSLFYFLQQRYHIEVTNMIQDIRAIEAPSLIADRLEIKVGSPIIHIYRKYSTSKEDYFIYSSLYCNTKDYAIGHAFS